MKEQELEQRKTEVNDLVDEAKELIKNEIDAKKMFLADKENDLKAKEVELVQRERKVREWKEAFSMDGEAASAFADVSSGKKFSESLPVSEKQFPGWDKQLPKKKDEVVN